MRQIHDRYLVASLLQLGDQIRSHGSQAAGDEHALRFHVMRIVGMKQEETIQPANSRCKMSTSRRLARPSPYGLGTGIGPEYTGSCQARFSSSNTLRRS